MTERRHEMSTADLATAQRGDGASAPTRTDDDPRFDTLLGTADPTPDRVPEATSPSPRTELAEDPSGEGLSAGATSSVGGPAITGPLMPERDSESFRARWIDVQTRFVDEPRESVQQADALVAELMQQLASTFADERARLEKQWDNDTDVATDNLRTAFQRYRSFFERLLAT
jgi:hypothetical protein